MAAISEVANPEITNPTSFLLDGQAVDALPGETILQAARRHGVDIPHLCYKDGLRPDGNCRACVVEVKGERALAASCCRTPQEGMDVATTSERARHSQKMVLELLLSDVVETAYTRDSELDTWARALAVGSRASHHVGSQNRMGRIRPLPLILMPVFSAPAVSVPAVKSR